MNEDATTGTSCRGCGKRIDECACCDEPDCGAAICYGCLNVAVGQAMPQPHTHGG